MKATGSWIRLPLDMLQDKDISLSACIIYAILLDKCSDDNDLIRISYKKLGEITGTGKNTAVRAIQELEKFNYIERITSPGNTQHIKVKVKLLPPKKRNISKQYQNHEEKEHSYNLDDYKQFVNNFPKIKMS